MVQAPIMVTCTMRVFTNSTKSYAACKFSTGGSCYLVKVFSNSCIKTRLYHRNESSELHALMRPNQSTVDDVLETVEREVSVALPRIDIDRLRMLAGDLNATDFEALMVAVRKKNIQVTGYVPPSPTMPAHHTHTETLEQDARNGGPGGNCSVKRKARDVEDSVDLPPDTSKNLKVMRLSTDDACVPSTSRAPDEAGRDTYDGTKVTSGLSVVDDSDVEYGFDDDD